MQLQGKFSWRGLRTRMQNIPKRLLKATATGRMVKVFPDDVFIVSYPKSGNTWTRFLVGNMLHQSGPVDFSNIEEKIPDIYVNSNSALLDVQRPRTLKSHECFDPRYRKVVYIVRDPRDVAVSYYHHLIKVGKVADGLPMSEFVGRFLDGELDRYGSWYENVASWLYTRGDDKRFLMLRYEDILDHTLRELRRLADFLEVSIGDDGINRAIELSSKDNMRKLERKQSHLWATTRGTMADKPFVRVGQYGGWKTDLPAPCARMIEEKWGCLLTALDYL
jgi:hypothetical protein